MMNADEILAAVIAKATAKNIQLTTLQGSVQCCVF